jgi:hypothetical protein
LYINYLYRVPQKKNYLYRGKEYKMAYGLLGNSTTSSEKYRKKFRSTKTS